jgi:hypothetical protein
MNIRTPIRAALSIAIVAMVALVFMSLPAMAILNDDLVEYWELDGDPNAEVDSTHNGTVIIVNPGSAAWVSGKFDQAIDLESSSNSPGKAAYVEVGGDPNDFDFFNQNMSVSLWYTTEELYVSWQGLIAKGEGSNWRLARNGDSATQLDFSPGSAGEASLDDLIGWHHVVGTSSTTTGTRLYVDGVLAGQDLAPNVYDGGGGGFNPMAIGANPDATGRAWDGKIDDVGVWNRVLSASEVSLIWNGGTGDSIASLLAQAPNLLTLEVNTLVGSMAILGDPTRSNEIDFYDISSPDPNSTLNPLGWSSLEDQDYEGNGAPGTGNGWEVLGVPSSNFLAEGFLLGSTTIGIGGSVGLGNGYNTSQDTQNLIFTYRNEFGEIVEGLVTYADDLPGDFDDDGDVDGADFLFWQIDPNVGSLSDWENNYGFVSPLSAVTSAVPEPSSLVLIVAGLLGMGARRRKQA